MAAPVQNSFGPPDARRSPLEESEIVERIHDAVIEQRLPPGTKLPEAALCRAFGVPRGRIRRSLLLLASRNIVVLHPNRGGFIAQPTAEEARDVFEARRTLESLVARLAAERAGPQDLATLDSHLGGEDLAFREHDRRRLIRLSGEFHVLVAAAAGNRVLHDVVKELVARTSLIIAMYGATPAENCRTDEHRDLLAALRVRDAGAAAELMEQHLRHIENRLDVRQTRANGIDLVEILSG